jgi:hypothetical protein
MPDTYAWHFSLILFWIDIAKPPSIPRIYGIIHKQQARGKIDVYFTTVKTAWTENYVLETNNNANKTKQKQNANTTYYILTGRL